MELSGPITQRGINDVVKVRFAPANDSQRILEREEFKTEKKNDGQRKPTSLTKQYFQNAVFIYFPLFLAVYFR